MELHWILCSTLLLVFAADCATPVAKIEPGTEVGCLGKIAAKFIKIAKDCSLDLPQPTTLSGRRKRAGKFVEPTPPPAPLTKDHRAAALCCMKKLNIMDERGISFTLLRRVLDDNFPGSPKQQIFWRNIKDAAETASNKNRSGDPANNMFMDGVWHAYNKLCPS